jgi:DME family drug/metabolite transporter
MSSTSPLVPWLLVLLAGALWGSGALVVAHLLAHTGLNSLEIALARFLIGLPALAWPLLRSGRLFAARSNAWVLLVGVAMAINVTCWFEAINRVGAGIATVIALCLAPVIVGVISVLTGIERISYRLVSAVILAVGGTALIVLGGTSSGTSHASLTGVGFAVLSALMYSILSLGTHRAVSRGDHSSVAFDCNFVAALSMPVIMIAIGQTGGTGQGTLDAWRLLDVKDILWLMYLGLGTASLAFWAFATGARRLSPTRVTVATLIEPLIAAVLGVIILGETLHAPQIAGAFGLFGAILLLARER